MFIKQLKCGAYLTAKIPSWSEVQHQGQWAVFEKLKITAMAAICHKG